MKNTVLQIDPRHRAIAAAALAVYTARRDEGWNMSYCVASVAFNAPRSVDDELNTVEHLPNEQLVEIISALLRSPSEVVNNC